MGAFQFVDVEAISQSMAPAEPENPFARLIGADRSLKRQVVQAMAAILYPPDGLHTLIVGQTGVGKTLFAHMMFEYGKTMHRFAEDAPFVTFNCADYYNNPDNEGHLLLALANDTDQDVTLEKGERVAQGIFYTYLLADDDGKAPKQERSGGFGSPTK